MPLTEGNILGVRCLVREDTVNKKKTFKIAAFVSNESGKLVWIERKEAEAS
jgi:hypothetical protein